MRFVPSLSLAFFAGAALLVAGQLVSDYSISAVLNLLGGALLVVVAIRGLAGLAGLHQEWTPSLAPDETLLVESQEAMVETRPVLFGGRRGPYRARLTNQRILLSLRVLLVQTRHDVTVAVLAPGQPLSVRSIEVYPSGEIVIQLARRFGARRRLWVRNWEEWREALNDSHPELLDYSPASSTST
jgi:hypothetical protein